ncbi:serine/threonine-protein kinase [Lignipirellula cremea]|uniref:Serine/threonine-protein kinase PknB n=1 Tax=Lignipirellula cremea TaxID=2528010 RepID=A0A518DL67_9BACT|nr:serine/threonine-protein kinase [Lignipirellula cremea]QDU92570.1 Serine/threonine-protein kinase PknB [Lignipirellula cremea]
MDPSYDIAQLPAKCQARIEEICEGFELSWQGSEPQDLADTVQKIDGGLQTVLLRELLQIEQHYRSRSLGRPVTAEELQQSHAQLAEEIQREFLLDSDGRELPATAFLREGSPGKQQEASDDDSSLFPQLPATLDRYRILQPLGSGGMGCVFLAEDTMLERQVALKFPHRDTRRSAAQAARFLQEAKAAATLNHPHLCAVHDVGEAAGLPYLSMEYIDGEPLSDRLRSGRRLTQTESVQLIRKLASALQEAHDQGVVHRDIKPANVMINHRGAPVLTDFGLAQRNAPTDSRLTQNGDLLGTPAYMSPEQIDGDLERIGPATDIYSLGAIFYELLSGQRPFRGSTAAVLGSIMTTDPQPIATLQPSVDPALEAICQRMMARPIEERFASMQEVADALESWSDAAQPAPASPRDRRPMAMPLIGTLAAIALACGVLFLVRTPKATFRVEVKDPQVRVLVDDQNLALTDGSWEGKKKAGPHQLGVMIGDQQLKLGETTVIRLDGEQRQVRLAVSGIEVVGDRFEIARDGKTSAVVEVIWEPDSVAGTPPVPEENAVAAAEISPTPGDEPLTEIDPMLDIDLMRDDDPLSAAKDPRSAAELMATGDWEWRVIKKLSLGSNAFEYDADMSADRLTLVFSGARSGGHGNRDLWMATRPSPDAPWSKVTNLGPEVNTEHSEYEVRLTNDGLTLGFVRMGENWSARYFSTRETPLSSWSTAQALDEDSDLPFHDGYSRDGLSRMQTQLRGPGHGLDLQLFQRTAPGEPWTGSPEAGPLVNTAADEMRGVISNDCRLLFFVRRTRATSDEVATHRIFVATRADKNSPWSEPTLLDHEFPYATSDKHRLLPDEKSLLFASSRPRERGSGICLARLVRKQPRKESKPAE